MTEAGKRYRSCRTEADISGCDKGILSLAPIYTVGQQGVPGGSTAEADPARQADVRLSSIQRSM